MVEVGSVAGVGGSLPTDGFSCSPVARGEAGLGTLACGCRLAELSDVAGDVVVGEGDLVGGEECVGAPCVSDAAT
jgi:hypothetical protein